MFARRVSSRAARVVSREVVGTRRWLTGSTRSVGTTSARVVSAMPRYTGMVVRGESMQSRMGHMSSSARVARTACGDGSTGASPLAVACSVATVAGVVVAVQMQYPVMAASANEEEVLGEEEVQQLSPEEKRAREVAKKQAEYHEAVRNLENGQYATARAQLKSVLEWQQLYLASDAPEVANTLYHLAFAVFMSSRDLILCVPYAAQAVELFERQGRIEEDIYLKALTNLGEFYKLQRKYKDSEREYTKALTVATQLHGEDSAQVALVSNNLGVVMGLRRNTKESVRLLRAALEVRERRSDERDVLRCMLNLAVQFINEEQYEEAEEILEELHPRTATVYGATSDEATKVQRYWGLTLMKLEEFARAEQLLGTVVTNMQFKLVENGANMLPQDVRLLKRQLFQSESALGVAQYQLDRLDESRGHLQRVYRHFTAQLGGSHPQTLRALVSLAEIDRKQGQVYQAEQMLLQALKQSRAANGGDVTYEAVYVLTSLGLLREQQADLKRAFRCLGKVVQLTNQRVKERPRGHNERLAQVRAYVNMGRLHLVRGANGDSESAWEYYSEAARIRMQTMGVESTRAWATREMARLQERIHWAGGGSLSESEVGLERQTDDVVALKKQQSMWERVLNEVAVGEGMAATGNGVGL